MSADCTVELFNNKLLFYSVFLWRGQNILRGEMNSVRVVVLGGRDLPPETPTTLVQFMKRVTDSIASLQLTVLPVEQQGCPSILCTVVGPLLDVQP